MSERANRLTDRQVDLLADGLEAFAAGGKRTTYHNYELALDPMRKLGVQRTVGLPREDTITSATFGLAHEDWTHSNFPHRIELVQAWNDPALDYERFLVAVAESIMRVRQLPKPGVIYQDAAVASRLDDLARRMPHALLLFPYLWDRFQKLDLAGTTVWFLQVVPIYENEKAFIEKNGFAKFEELLEFDGAHFHDLKRLSHITP